MIFFYWNIKVKNEKKYELSLTEGVVPHIVTSHDSYSLTLW